MKPPVPAKKPIERTHHGDTVVDNFDWLRDKESQEVLEHLNAENAYADQILEPLHPLRDQIVSEIKSHTQETDSSVPFRDGDYRKRRTASRRARVSRCTSTLGRHRVLPARRHHPQRRIEPPRLQRGYFWRRGVCASHRGPRFGRRDRRFRQGRCLRSGVLARRLGNRLRQE